jgi:outer membrane protein assembly factor BamB
MHKPADTTRTGPGWASGRSTVSTLAAGTAVLFLALPARLAAEDWPQFRGPNGSGISTESRGLPTHFSHKDKVAWSATLGDGVGCPIVFGGRVYATAMTGPQEFSVFCFDAATGKQHWTKNYPTGKLPRITPPNSHASSTPATDGQRVYVYFSTLGLRALDCATGKEVWHLPLPVPAFLMDWGAAASPIVYKDQVIFNQDDDLTPFLIAIDSSTGKVRWKTRRDDMLGGYAVPVLCEANGRTDIVVAGTGKLKGYDPATGKELWTCNTLLRTIMTSPVVRDGVIYTAVQSYGDSGRTLKFALLEWLDTNQDGKLSRDEVPKEFLEKFDQSDKTKKGYLVGDELETAFQSPSNMVGGGNTVQAVRGGGTGDVTKTHLLWNQTKIKAPSNLSSPLVLGDQVYVVKAGGLSSCFDAHSGKSVWELQRLGNRGDYYASPIAADGKIFIAGKNGFVLVLAEGPELKVLARNNDMRGEILATPAIADGRLFIRTRDKLYCISNEAKGTTRR